MGSGIAGAKVTRIDMGPAPQSTPVAEAQGDAGADDWGIELDLERAAAELVLVEAEPAVAVGHEDVDIAVVVDVAEGGAAAGFDVLQAGACVFEALAANVVKELIWLVEGPKLASSLVEA